MKIKLLSGIALSVMAFAAVPAQAEEFKPYVSVFAGGSFLNPVDTKWGSRDYTVKTNMGYLIGGAVGVKWTDMLRTEIELSHSSNNAKEFNVNSDPFQIATGPISATSIFGNVWFDISNQSSFTPYVGGGLGVGWADADVSRTFGAVYGANISGAALAYQIGAGVKFGISESIDLDFGYRFKGLGKTDFNGAGPFDYEGATFTSHNLQAGLTLQF